LTPPAGADLICIKSALSVLDIDLPIKAAYTTQVSSEEPPHLVASYDTRGDVEDLF
jgi:hypothetical protein